MAIPKPLIHVAEHIGPETDLATAARRMEDWNIGSLVVVGPDGPVGLVTDRDVALHVLENELDPKACRVADCMSDTLVSVRADESITDAVERMREHGIRRLPVLDGAGKLAGIVTADDLVLALARDLNHLAAAIRRGIVQEGAGTASPASVFGKE
jgi:CBS domain-containing protein